MAFSTRRKQGLESRPQESGRLRTHDPQDIGFKLPLGSAQSVSVRGYGSSGPIADDGCSVLHSESSQHHSLDFRDVEQDAAARVVHGETILSTPR